MAALAGDRTLIQAGYFRNTDVVAARMEQNPTRRKFIAWAVDYLRERGNEEITHIALLQAWHAIPIETRCALLDTPRENPPKPDIYFADRCGVKLTMAELWKRALEVPAISPAPMARRTAVATDTWSGPARRRTHFMRRMTATRGMKTANRATVNAPWIP
jgi:hypothetical protein